MMAGDILICFNCCLPQPPAPKKPRIDRSMIGNPTDFRHTGHIGSGDVNSNPHAVDSLQTQMQSKGGYKQVSPVNVQFSLLDLQTANSLKAAS